MELWVFEVGDDAWSNRAWACSVHEPVGTSIEEKKKNILANVAKRVNWGVGKSKGL